MRALKMLCFLLAFGVTAAATPSLAAAQSSPTDPDTLITAALSPGTGIALAHSQIADRDLLAALGTLERVLFAHPEAVPARLLYTSLLCRLDDREGAEVEIRLLAGQPIAAADWSEVTTACGSIAPPAPPRGRRQ
jgi:hypothetical protein